MLEWEELKLELKGPSRNEKVVVLTRQGLNVVLTGPSSSRLPLCAEVQAGHLAGAGEWRESLKVKHFTSRDCVSVFPLL